MKWNEQITAVIEIVCQGQKKLHLLPETQQGKVSLHQQVSSCRFPEGSLQRLAQPASGFLHHLHQQTRDVSNLNECDRMCVYIYICVCVCVCTRTLMNTHMHIQEICLKTNTKDATQVQLTLTSSPFSWLEREADLFCCFCVIFSLISTTSSHIRLRWQRYKILTNRSDFCLTIITH